MFWNIIALAGAAFMGSEVGLDLYRTFTGTTIEEQALKAQLEMAGYNKESERKAQAQMIDWLEKQNEQQAAEVRRQEQVASRENFNTQMRAIAGERFLRQPTETELMLTASQMGPPELPPVKHSFSQPITAFLAS